MNKSFGVIFDMDGVLVDSNPTHKKTIKLFCKKYNRQISEEFLRKRIYGRTSKEWIPEVFEDISREDADRLIIEKGKMFRDIFDPRSAVIPGLLDFLEQLKNLGIKSVIATSASKENADFILSELSVEHYFDAVLDSSHIDKGKPAPEIYLKASKAINYSPEQCVIFEDSMAGVEAGVRAGAKVIGISSTHTAGEMKTCTKVVNNFTELTPEVLRSLFD